MWAAGSDLSGRLAVICMDGLVKGMPGMTGRRNSTGSEQSYGGGGGECFVWEAGSALYGRLAVLCTGG